MKLALQFLTAVFVSAHNCDQSNTLMIPGNEATAFRDGGLHANS